MIIIITNNIVINSNVTKCDLILQQKMSRADGTPATSKGKWPPSDVELDQYWTVKVNSSTKHYHVYTF